MAYADRDVAGSRIVAIVVVAIIILAVGYAFVTGLAYKYVKQVSEELKVVDVDEPPPPPPEEPPPPPPDIPMTPPPVVSPPPIVQTPQAPVNVIPTVTTPPPVYVPTPVVVAPPAPPPPPRVSQKASAKGNPNRYFSSDNYPPDALRAEAEGRTGVRITIGTDGRVTDCQVTSPSGNASLDNATCKGARRISYSAAKDDNGTPITSTQSFAVSWKLPTD